MAAKKKRTRQQSAEFKRRSQAAKKGWETRRKSQKKPKSVKPKKQGLDTLRRVVKQAIALLEAQAKKKSRGKSKASKAAIKGWVTREKNKLERQLDQAVAVHKRKPKKKQPSKPKKPAPKRPSIKDKKIQQLQEENARVVSRLEGLEAQLYTRDDGLVSPNPSRLRVIATKEERDAIREGLRKARDEDWEAEYIDEVCEFYDVSAQEVYTIYYS